MKTYNIKTETADNLRTAAPMFGMTPCDKREVIAPGIEAMHLNPFIAVEFDALCKAAKVSADVMINRILKKAAA